LGWAGLEGGGMGGAVAVFGVDVGDIAVFPCRALADAVIGLAQVGSDSLFLERDGGAAMVD